MISAAPVVRRAVESDAPKIAELLGELGYSVHPTFIRDRLLLVASRPDDRAFVAEAAESVVGVVSVTLFPAFHADVWIARINALVVSAHHRRKGIGRLLLAASEEYAWGHRCTQVEVTSGGTHEPAPAFYEDNGYEPLEGHLIKPRP